MSSSHFTSSIYVLTFTLLLQTIFGDNSVFYKCSIERSVANDLYASNREKLLVSIASKTPVKGFRLVSIGQKNESQANGITLCRGDVDVIDCQTCVDEAISDAKKICPDNKDVIIWYDNCLVKYSSSYFFGQVDTYNRFRVFSDKTASQPQIFIQKAKELLTRLAKEATLPNAYYATGELVLEGSNKLYGLAQCTLDISLSDCFKCLNDEINDGVNGKEGGRYLGGSCTIRYEVSPFLNG